MGKIKTEQDHVMWVDSSGPHPIQIDLTVVFGEVWLKEFLKLEPEKQEAMMKGYIWRPCFYKGEVNHAKSND